MSAVLATDAVPVTVVSDAEDTTRTMSRTRTRVKVRVDNTCSATALAADTTTGSRTAKGASDLEGLIAKTLKTQLAAQIGELIKAGQLDDCIAKGLTARDKVDDDAKAKEQADARESLQDDIFEQDHGSADAADLTNLYSYAIIQIDHLLSTPISARRCGRLLFMIMYATTLTGIQLLFAYGFYDASVVLKVQYKTLESFRDPLPFSFWYAESVIPGTQEVMLNVILSVCAVVLLAVYLKNDNEGTLVTVCPLEMLCLPQAGGGAPHVFAHGPLSVAWRLVVVLLAQITWCLRALLMPVLAGYGTVGAMLNASNGQDIVLNSVAIGFVLELDEFLYDNLLGKATHEYHQKFALPATAPLAVQGGSSIATVHAKLIYVLDLVLLLHAFFTEVYDPSHIDLPTMVEVDIRRRYDRFRIHIMMRATMLALAQGHLAMAGAKVRQMSRLSLVPHVFILMALMIASAAGIYTFVLAGLLDTHLGCSFPTVMLSPRTMACCVPAESMEMVMNPLLNTLGFGTLEDIREGRSDCEMLDDPVAHPGIFERVVQEASYADRGDPMRFAWGDYPEEGKYMLQTMCNFMSHMPMFPGSGRDDLTTCQMMMNMPAAAPAAAPASAPANASGG